MLKIHVKRLNCIPVLNVRGKISTIDDKPEEDFIEEYPLEGVENIPEFRKRMIDQVVDKITRFNWEEEQKALRDRKNPKSRIRKLLIHSIT